MPKTISCADLDVVFQACSDCKTYLWFILSPAISSKNPGLLLYIWMLLYPR